LSLLFRSGSLVEVSRKPYELLRRVFAEIHSAIEEDQFICKRTPYFPAANNKSTNLLHWFSLWGFSRDDLVQNNCV
jgi:hypothetical protein